MFACLTGIRRRCSEGH